MTESWQRALSSVLKGIDPAIIPNGLPLSPSLPLSLAYVCVRALSLSLPLSLSLSLSVSLSLSLSFIACTVSSSLARGYNEGSRLLSSNA